MGYPLSDLAAARRDTDNWRDDQVRASRPSQRDVVATPADRALDRALRATMRAELREFQRALGITVVLGTHDQDEAVDLSDRVAVMRAGRLQQVAPPRELYERPANAFVAGFVGGSDLLEAAVVGVEGEFAVVRTAGVQAGAELGSSRRSRARVFPSRRGALAEAGGARGRRGGCGRSRADRAWPRPPRRRRARDGDPGPAGGRARAMRVALIWPPDEVWLLAPEP
jgi:hypothetical protein